MGVCKTPLHSILQKLLIISFYKLCQSFGTLTKFMIQELLD
ncbi:hypothetical protein HMPREF9073_01839 [Capnocytophaga sp. oral taxon 326 str. F0382]|nr:hypothetical protein HMPREF9073_01839 [Capnocytophaga sp. oral taxon 326 str. F0382]